MKDNLKKTLRDRLKISWSLYKLLWPTAVAWICAIGAFGIGLVYSSHETFSPFARSGSAATAIFILSTIVSVDRLANRSEQLANNRFKKLTNTLHYTGSKSQAEIEAKTAKNTEHLLRINIFLSATGLCLATLVWGFGDIFGG